MIKNVQLKSGENKLLLLLLNDTKPLCYKQTKLIHYMPLFFFLYCSSESGTNDNQDDEDYEEPSNELFGTNS